jgi:molybdopterin/thiamine biosynthesis adenylyltransferase
MTKDRLFYFSKVKNYKDLKGTITIVGLEGTGIVLAEILTRAGFNLRIIDKGRVYLEELQGQSLFLEEDVTKFKAKQAKKRLEDINKDVKIKAFHEELTPETIYLLDADVVIDCTNTLAVSKMVHDYTLKQELPGIFVSCIGSKVNVFVQKGKDISSKLKDYDISKEGVLGSSTYTAAGLVSALVYKILKSEEVKDKYVFDVDNF